MGTSDYNDLPIVYILKFRFKPCSPVRLKLCETLCVDHRALDLKIPYYSPRDWGCKYSLLYQTYVSFVCNVLNAQSTLFLHQGDTGF